MLLIPPEGLFFKALRRQARQRLLGVWVSQRRRMKKEEIESERKH
jgi:hypothetical protein